jgi:rhamnopyranosyl-N-acetylglucosaminyl-diphospho-decaprenol beta-1,3/1,4-galactofuranosyltransferase
VNVATVVVAFNRDSLLKGALDSILKQSLKSDVIIVVDNAVQDSTKALVKEFKCHYLVGNKNLGGGGGFSLGMRFALSIGAQKIWLLDDDGRPAKDCLKTLMESSTKLRYEVVSPLVISNEESTFTANTFYFGLRKVDQVSYLKKKEVRENKVQFFNGVLLDSTVIERIGFPRADLFIRGDELDYYYRCKPLTRMALITNAELYHPSSQSEYAVNRRRLFSVSVPSDPIKRYYQLRNRGYLIRRYRLHMAFVFDLIRYPLTFLIYKKMDVDGFIEWIKLWGQGLKLDLSPHPEHRRINEK